MGSRGRRTLAGAVAAAAAGTACAVALAAAGSGTPQTEEVGGGWTAMLVSHAERTCTGTDGEYTERLMHYQAPADMTLASDPRFDGLLDFHLHQLYLTAPTDGLPVGHIDGTAHWFASDTGKETAFARINAVWREGFIDGALGGRGRTDGFAVPFGDLPRADVYGTITLEETVPGMLLGKLGSDKEALANIGTPTQGAILQSFNCDGRYEPVDAGASPLTALSASGQRKAIKRMKLRSRQGLTVRQARGSRAKLRVPAPAAPITQSALEEQLGR